MDLKAIKEEKPQVILPISNKTLELKNLVTKKEYRNIVLIRYIIQKI